MNIFRLSYRNMLSRPLGTLLSLTLLALSVGLIALIIQVNQQIQEKLENNIRDIDMVVGAKGSPLQLILSAVYQLDVPTGNIELDEVKKIQKHRLVESTIPLSYGDSHKGFRIVGTTQQYPEHYKAIISEGRPWNKSFEVNIGYSVAEALNLKVGDQFNGEHGFSEGGEMHEDHAYKIVGIYEASNCVIDQLILTATESVWRMHDHGHEEQSQEDNHDNTTDKKEQHNEDDHSHHEDHDHELIESSQDHREITALLVKFKSPIALIQLPRMINETTNMQAAVPAYEVSRLYDLMGIGIDLLNALALLIMIVSGLSLFISLYSALKDRIYELAIMRTYGASRWQLLWLIMQEGLLLSLIGFTIGIIFSRLALYGISLQLASSYHYQMNNFTITLEEMKLLIAAMLIGLFASMIPAIKAFNIDISKTLTDA